MDFLKEVIKKVGDEYASLAANIKENEEYIDTGSYILNALLSGSLFGGISKNKITALAAPESCGKTFIALSVVNNFLQENPDGMCVYFDTESAITKKLLESKGIDTKRVVVMNVVTIEEFRSKALQIVDIYSKRPEEERKPLILVLDSLGMLSTNHEINTTLEGKDTRDMSKAQLTKGAFRMLTLKLGEVGIPMIVNNHLYKTMSLYSSDEMSSGCLVAGTQIVTMDGNKAIDAVTTNDFVMTKEGEWRRVLQTHHLPNKEIIEIEFEDGTKVQCTPEHKFFVDGALWVEAKDLFDGALIDMVESNRMKIKSITKKENADVFDISVDQYENYILSNGVITHNSGLKYSASTIVYISKSKEKEGTDIVGVLLRFKTVKSRLSRENRDVQVRLFYDERGLDRYYGLFELGVESGVIKRENQKTYSFDGKRFSKADIVDHPETFFTQEVLEKLDEYAQQKFCYGSTLVCESDPESESEEEEVNGKE
jgi:RecA/RadA recombinase